jgi:hypothetical protein
MITIAKEKWIADLGNMTCRNIENNIAVTFERSGKALQGKIKDTHLSHYILIITYLLNL